MKDSKIRKAKRIYYYCKKIRKNLEAYKHSDISIQIDLIYFSYLSLYKILSTYNISFGLYFKCEKFIEEGYGTISSIKLSDRISDIILLYDELLKLLKTEIEKGV